ncbi:MAG: ribonuclease P protein component [Lachnospiraceae bacterium]|nr:ribonuclease P protein component [Lachnospiraceae bacterium]
MNRFPSIRKNEDFKKVYRSGKSCANDSLIMYVLKRDDIDGSGRIGISVSKKVGNSVVRHRVARVVRECYRLHRDEVKSGYDIVVIARQPAAAYGYKEMSCAYMNLCSRMGIII